MIGNKLIQYCKHNDFPIDEMGEDCFKAIKKSLGYQRYLLAYLLIEINREVVKSFEKVAKYIVNKIDDLLNDCLLYEYIFALAFCDGFFFLVIIAFIIGLFLTLLILK